MKLQLGIQKFDSDEASDLLKKKSEIQELLDGPNEIRPDGHLSRLGRQLLLPPKLYKGV